MTSTSSETSFFTISKETIQRLLKDVKQLIENPLDEQGIYYCHDDEDILKGYAMIIGPEDTPYFGGYYFFKFNFPNNYPFSPPKVTFCTNDGITRYNPNLYVCGKVCLSILNTWSGEKWSSCQTINSILLTLVSVLNEEPLLNEPGVLAINEHTEIYKKAISYKNIDFSICNFINKNNLDKEFHDFYPIIIDNFIKNFPKLINFVENNVNIKENIYTFYHFYTKIDYEKLRLKLIESYENINNL